MDMEETANDPYETSPSVMKIENRINIQEAGETNNLPDLDDANKNALASLSTIKPMVTQRPFEDKVAEVRRIRRKRRFQAVPHISEASQQAV